MTPGRLILPLLATASLAWTQPGSAPARTGPEIAKRVSDSCKKAQSYSFEGSMLLAAKQGKTGESRVLATSKFKLVVGEQGKSYLKIKPQEKDEYLLVSNGQKSWEFVPALKQYTEQEGASVGGSGDDDGDDDGGGTNEKDLNQSFAWQIMTILRTAYETAQAADIKEPVEVKYDGKKYKWPVVRVMSRKSARGELAFTQMVMDPETQRIGRLLWSTAQGDESDENKTVLQLQVDFSTFELGPVDDSTFNFDPPKNSKKVDAVPIPGQTGSFLLSKPAPDFELKTLDGERIKLSDLRGKPVLLNFWASWCGPCRSEMPAIAKLAEDFKAKGLIVLGLNDEGKGAAKEFAKKYDLPFATLDDSGRKAHRLYRVQAIPSTYVIAPDGKIARFLRGSQKEADFRAALKSVGL